jgi:hypothetical protein
MMAKLRRLAISSGGAAAARSFVVVRVFSCGRNAAAVARSSRDIIAGSTQLGLQQDVKWHSNSS